MASLMLCGFRSSSLHIARSLRSQLVGLHKLSTSPCQKCVTATYSSGICWNRTAFLQSVKELHILKVFVPGRMFSMTIRRSAKKPSRSWDVDGTVSKDTLVYSYKNDRYHRMITIFGIVQLMFWGNLALFSYSGLSQIDEQALRGSTDRNSFWGQVTEYQVKYRYRIAVACMAVGYAVMFFTWMYPQRSIRKLTLLTGGNNLRVTTYTHLGKTREFEVPLSTINSTQTRTVDQPTMSFKIKGHWFYYIIDKKNGVFHEPVLFDNVVNLKRDIK